MCLPTDVKAYVAHHMRDDAENHRSMTSMKYHDSHKIMWDVIDWETWKKVMDAQVEYSTIAADLIEGMPACKE